jgi:hypothetical protein
MTVNLVKPGTVPHRIHPIILFLIAEDLHVHISLALLSLNADLGRHYARDYTERPRPFLILPSHVLLCEEPRQSTSIVVPPLLARRRSQHFAGR